MIRISHNSFLNLFNFWFQSAQSNFEKTDSWLNEIEPYKAPDDEAILNLKKFLIELYLDILTVHWRLVAWDLLDLVSS